MKRAGVELAAALSVCVISVAGVAEASGYRGASAYMPVTVTVLAATLSLVWGGQCAVTLFRGDGESLAIPAVQVWRFATVIGIAILYVLGITHAGFFTATVIMIPLLALSIGYRNLTLTLVATGAFCILLYAVFRLLLSIPLPPERILQWTGS